MNKTKKSFLRQLRWALFWHLPNEEARAIVEDYSGFFDDRMDEGKTEAEVCREFGTPSKVVQEILREPGRRTQALGVWIIVWVLLTGFLNWWWTWERYGYSGFGQIALYIVQFLLIPALWLCWREALDNHRKNLPHSRCWHAVIYGIPTAVWAVFYGYYAWCMLIFVPRLQALPFEQQTGGANVGIVIGTLKEVGSLLVLAVLALLLVWVWREGNPRLMPGAAWCVGCLCSMSQLYTFSTHLDGSAMPLSPLSVLLPPLAVLMIIGAGGAALTALLIWKGGCHGRTA